MNTGPKYVQALYGGGIIICLSVAEWNNKREFLIELYLQTGFFSCQLILIGKKKPKRFIQCDIKHSRTGVRIASSE